MPEDALLPPAEQIAMLLLRQHNSSTNLPILCDISKDASLLPGIPENRIQTVRALASPACGADGAADAWTAQQLY